MESQGDDPTAKKKENEASPSAPLSPPDNGQGGDYQLSAGTTLSVRWTDHPWELPGDALVVPFDARWDPGGLWRDFLTRLPGETRQLFDAYFTSQVEGPLTPRQPKVFWEGSPRKLLPKGSRLRLLVAVSAFGDPEDSPTVQNAALASERAVQLARERRAKGVILPVIGAGEAGLEPLEVIRTVLKRLTKNGPYEPVTHIILTDHREQVVEAARKEIEALLTASPQTPPVVDLRPGYVSDLDTPQDSLGIHSHVTSFAKLLAAQDVIAPLSLGLFAAWGMGKTYFMDRLRERIDDFSGNDLRSADGQRVYCRRIAHISFNAWHYVDKDLWASLALRIFDGLGEELSDLQDGSASQTLRSKIESTEKRRARAQQQRHQAEKEMAAAEKELRKNQARKKEVEKELFNRLKENLPLEKDLKPILKDAQALGLGSEESVESIDDLRKILEQLQDSKNRALNILAALGSIRWNWLVGISTLVILALVLTMTWLYQEAQALVPWALAAEFTAALGGGAVWVGKRLKSFRESTSGLDELLQKIESHVAESDERETDLAGTLEAIDTIQSEIATLQERQRQADKIIATAEDEILRLKSGGLVYDFLEERGQDPLYSKKLGVISTVRRDLEQLKALLEEWTQDLAEESGDEGARNEKQDGRPSKPAIDRIILYIDDLDRCDRESVVEVLQAVHLLLAFPLFIVVVAVDPRWLEHSLKEVYQVKGEAPFSAQQYLEKIFQIPFTLPAMTPEGFGQLVDDLIETENEFSREDSARIAGTAGAAEPSAPPGGAELLPEEEPMSQTDQEQDQVESELEDISASVLLSEPEERFLKKLHGFATTPRLVKRMINVYRLLRVRAADPSYIDSRNGTGKPYSFERFLGDENNAGEFRLVMVLLTLNVGTPHLGSSILRRIMKQKHSGIKELIKEMRDVEGTGSGDKKAELPAHHVRVLRRLENLIESGEISDDLSLYRRWAPEVGRYSFYWHQSAYKLIEKVRDS